MDNKERLQAIIDRISQELKEEGYEVNNIHESSAEGPGDASSFFDYLVDLKLDGQKIPTTQVLWESFKKQLNHSQKLVRYADEEYEKVYTKYRGLEEQIKDLREENFQLKKKNKTQED